MGKPSMDHVPEFGEGSTCTGTSKEFQGGAWCPVSRGVLLLMLSAYPCGPHHCMLMPGQAGVPGLWLQGLERQEQT